MKKLLLITLGIALPMGSLLHALTQVGNGDLFLDARLDYSYDSNLFLRETDKRSDSMYNVYVGAGFIQHERSVLNVDFDIGYDITQMFKFKEEDAEDFKSSFHVSYPNHVEGNAYFEVSGGYNEDTQANADIGQRIRTEALDLQGEYHQDISDKVGVEFTLGTMDQNYKNGIDPRNNLALNRESDLWNVGLAGTYFYSEKLVGLLSYTHRELTYNDTTSTEQDGDIIAVGARGQLSPKISGGISFGFQDVSLKSSFIGSQSYTDPFYSVDVAWNPRDKTTVSISGSSNFQASVYGDVNNRNDIQFVVTEAMSEKSSITGGIVYSDNDYEGLFDRTDESLIFTAGYFYSFNDKAQFNVRLNYEDRDSNFDGLSFDRLFMSVGVSTLW